MPLWVAGIGAAAGLLGSKISANRAGDQQPASDTRTTDYSRALEEILQNTTNEEERNSIQSMLSQINTRNQSISNEQAKQTSEETGAQTGSVNRGDASTQNALQSLLTGGGVDSSAAMDAAMQRVLRSGAPAIANSANNAGAFNSTVQAQLQNDLTTKAAEASAGVQLQQDNTNRQALLDAIRAGQSGTEASTAINKTQAVGSTDTTNNSLTTGTQNTNQNTTTSENTKGTSEVSSINSSQELGDTYVDVKADGGIKTPTAGTPLNVWQGGSDPLRTALEPNFDTEVRGPITGDPMRDNIGGAYNPNPDYRPEYTTITRLNPDGKPIAGGNSSNTGNVDGPSQNAGNGAGNAYSGTGVPQYDNPMIAQSMRPEGAIAGLMNNQMAPIKQAPIVGPPGAAPAMDSPSQGLRANISVSNPSASKVPDLGAIMGRPDDSVGPVPIDDSLFI